MGKVIQHPVKKFQIHIEKIKENGTFSDFMDLLISAIDNKLDVGPLIEVWEQNKEHMAGENLLADFSKILPQLEIKYPEKAPTRPEKVLNDDKKELQDETVKLLEELAKGEKEFEDVKNTLKHRYSWFNPAWEACDLLMEYFPEEEDPGKKMGEYFDLIYPNYVPDDIDRITVQFEDHCHKLICHIGQWVLGQSNYPEPFLSAVRLALEILLDPRSAEQLADNDHARLIFEVLHLLPKNFVRAWFEEWLHEDPGAEGDPTLDNHIFKTLFTTFPTLEPFLRWPKASSFSYMTNDLQFESAPKSPRDIPPMSPKIIADLYHRADCSVLKIDEEIEKITLSWMPKVTETRRKNGGVSLFDIDQAHNLMHFLENTNISWSCIDLSLIPTSALFSFSDFSVFSYDVMPSEGSTLRGANKERRTSAYLQFYEKTRDEGYLEFANAILAFFVFSQAIGHKGNLGDMSVLIPIFQNALGKPGTEMLERALTLTAYWAEEVFPKEPGNLLIAKNLKAMLPESDQKYRPKKEAATTDVVRRKSRVAPKEVEEDLKAFILGKDRWERLHPDSREFLKQAELNWRLKHPFLGNGVDDWGSLILDYCKVFEKELVVRYETVLSAKAYQEFKEDRGERPPSKLTGGYVIRDLRGYNKLPESIKGLIDACGLNLPSNKKVLNEINDLFFKFRNNAAHTEVMDSEKFVAFRKTIFTGELLKRFLDTLKPLPSNTPLGKSSVQ